MDSDLNVVLSIHSADAKSGAYRVWLWHEGKPLASATAHIDTSKLLEHEHTFSAQKYGMALYEAVFTRPMARIYHHLIGKAGAEAAIRVQLVIDPKASELNALPWERFFHVFGDEDVPLAASARTPFSRFMVSGVADEPPVSADRVRLLLALANPVGLPKGWEIDVKGEVQAMADLLAWLGALAGLFSPS